MVSYLTDRISMVGEIQTSVGTGFVQVFIRVQLWKDKRAMGVWKVFLRSFTMEGLILILVLA
ncbi:hypothetical protein MtrunA17_Chr8g0364771 [Medicago truncatula]|uniref:Uncharacterized protein n=1 Tax=Medicago truncatula TaxID=3880 RepID=A0A396GP20_MEDTR|nr:hypothetical protein MtrunA17_Chr8g0364771 [Medicago truncatula]